MIHNISSPIPNSDAPAAQSHGPSLLQALKAVVVTGLAITGSANARSLSDTAAGSRLGGISPTNVGTGSSGNPTYPSVLNSPTADTPAPEAVNPYYKSGPSSQPGRRQALAPEAVNPYFKSGPSSQPRQSQPTATTLPASAPSSQAVTPSGTSAFSDNKLAPVSVAAPTGAATSAAKSSIITGASIGLAAATVALNLL